jgi:succinate dehydrogenase flavin-adding protein (antitoxin of CptAB toxin-antitoxin module)
MKLLKIEEDILNKAYVALNKINIIYQDNDIIDNDIIDNYRYFNYIKQHCEENTEKYKEFLKKIDKDILNLIKKKEDLLNLIHPDNDFKLCLDNAIQYVEENLKRTNEFTLIADYIDNLEEKKRNKKFILISANKFKILEEKLKN